MVKVNENPVTTIVRLSGHCELTELSLDLRALAEAEIDAAWIDAVRAYVTGEADEEPDFRLFGLDQIRAGELSLQVLVIQTAVDVAA